MMNEEWRQTAAFGELRSLVHQPASEGVWQQLCALLQTEEAERHAEEWLFYTDRLLDFRWPDALRVLQPSWINERPVAMQLCRALHLHRSSCFQPPRLLETLALARLPITVLRVMLWPKLIRRDEELWELLAPTLRELTFEPQVALPLGALDVGLLGELRELELHDPHMNMPLMTHLLAPGQLPALRRLSLRRVATQIAPLDISEVVVWLIMCGALERIEELELEKIFTLESEHLPKFLSKLRHSPLRALTFSVRGKVGRSMLNRLFDLAPLNAQLEQLTFKGIDITDEALRIHAPLTRLRELTLANMKLTRADCAALHPDNLPALRRLDLSHCRISDELLDHLRLLPWPDPPPQIEAQNLWRGAEVLGTIDAVLLGPPMRRGDNSISRWRGGRRDS
jgi:hypothetical protein